MSGPYRVEQDREFGYIHCVCGPGMPMENAFDDKYTAEQAARMVNAAHASGAKAEKLALAERLLRASGSKCPLCCEEFRKLADELTKEATNG